MVCRNHILWTGYRMIFLLLALHGVWNMGKRLVTRPRGQFWWRDYGCQTSVASCQNIPGPRIIEILSKRLCFSLPHACISLLAASSFSGKRMTATQHSHSHTINLLEQNRKEETYLASKSAVHRRYFVPNHNPQPPPARSLAISPFPKPSRSHNHIPHQYSDARRHNTVSTTRDTAPQRHPA